MADNNYCYFKNTQEQKRVVYLFAHGLGGDFNQIVHYVNVPATKADGTPFSRQYLVNGSGATFNFPDVDEKGNQDQTRTDLGQQEDMKALNDAYEKTCQVFPHDDIVLIGVSRGASAIINWVAHYKPERVKALILESPFDHPLTILKNKLRNFCIKWIPGSERLGTHFMKKNFPKVDLTEQGIFPCNTIKQLPHDLPVLLVHSREDGLIPAKCSIKLYNAVCNAGNTKSTLTVLDHGHHANILWGKSGPEYRQSVQSFLQKHL